MSFWNPEPSRSRPVVMPLNQFQKTGGNWMTDLLNTPAPQFPAMQIPGMSDAELQSQNLLGQYINSGTPTDFGLGMDQLRKTTMGGYDPFTSPEYEGYRRNSALEEERAVNKVAGRAQSMGMYGSTPAFTGEGMTRQGFTNDRMSYLGQLLNQERGRQLSASGLLMEGANYESERPLKQASAAQGLGALPREIEQLQNQAMYNQIMQQLMFPYETQSNLAANLMGLQNQIGNKATGEQESGLSNAMDNAGDIAQLIAMFYAGGSDRRMKENIKPIDSALEKVNKLKGYSYNYKFNSEENRNGGVMAQELEKVLPDAVSEINGVKFVRYDAVVGLLINAINELSLKIKG